MCVKQRALVRREWPNGIPLTRASALRAAELGLDTGWAAEKLLPPAACAKFEKIIVAAIAKYDKTRASADAECRKTCADAFINYLPTSDPADGYEYQKTCADAHAEYRKTCDESHAEFFKTRALTLLLLLTKAVVDIGN